MAGVGDTQAALGRAREVELRSRIGLFKDEARRAVEARRDDLIDRSHRIHANPKLAFREEKSSQWVADVLARAGFSVTKPACDIATAFVACTGHGPLHLAICAEYDALPGIGHACGHNVIASAAVGAGIGLADCANAAGLTVSVIGTPAEELGDAGGKILLLERGAFQGVHAAMMVHPAPFDVVMPGPVVMTDRTRRLRRAGGES